MSDIPIGRPIILPTIHTNPLFLTVTLLLQLLFQLAVSARLFYGVQSLQAASQRGTNAISRVTHVQVCLIPQEALTVCFLVS